MKIVENLSQKQRKLINKLKTVKEPKINAKTETKSHYFQPGKKKKIHFKISDSTDSERIRLNRIAMLIVEKNIIPQPKGMNLYNA